MMNINHTFLADRSYTAPDVTVVELLAKGATLLGASQIEDYGFNEIL